MGLSEDKSAECSSMEDYPIDYNEYIIGVYQEIILQSPGRKMLYIIKVCQKCYL